MEVSKRTTPKMRQLDVAKDDVTNFITGPGPLESDYVQRRSIALRSL